jgi:TorA maturation chaperone TorD
MTDSASASASADPTSAEIDRALCRGALYGALAAALRPPLGENLALVDDPDCPEMLREAAAALDGGDGSLEAAIEAWIGALRRSAPQDLEREYQRLFGHAAGGAVSPYETEYGPKEVFRQSQDLADAAGFYRAFGLALASSAHERADHAAAECEFASFLACKEAHELAIGRVESLEVVRRAAQLFLRDHLGRFGRAFASALESASRIPFYRETARCLAAWLTADCVALDVEAGPRAIALCPAEDPDVPMGCGTACETACGLAAAVGNTGAEAE